MSGCRQYLNSLSATARLSLRMQGIPRSSLVVYFAYGCCLLFEQKERCLEDPPMQPGEPQFRVRLKGRWYEHRLKVLPGSYLERSASVYFKLLSRFCSPGLREGGLTTLNYLQQREQMVQAAQLLHQAGVLSHSGHGNMSARLPEAGLMLLTSVSHLMHLSPEQQVVVTFDGKVVEGQLDPTTREIVGMHACVYRERPEVNAVIHTHSPRATSFALAHQPLPCVYEAFLRFGITDDIPVAEWAPRGSPEAVNYIVAQLKQHPTVPAVLLANHGLLAFSHDPLATARLLIIMEESAQLTLDARTLGGVQPFPPGALEKERSHMERFGSTR